MLEFGAGGDDLEDAVPLTDDVVVRRRVSVQAQATAQRRVAIIDAAALAFADVGYNATSLRDIAARAGLSHTGLLHHFPDKPSLLEAVLDHEVDRAAELYPLESSAGDTFLRAYIDIAGHDQQHPEKMRLFAILSAEALTPGHPAHGYMSRWYQQVRERLTHAFEDLERRGLYRGQPLTPEQAAIQVSSLRDGATLQCLHAAGTIEVADTVRSLICRFADIDTD